MKNFVQTKETELVSKRRKKNQDQDQNQKDTCIELLKKLTNLAFNKVISSIEYQKARNCK
jgi:hypothetical protein